MNLPLINKSSNPFPQHETQYSAGFDIKVNLVNIEQLKSLNPEIDIIDNEKDNVSNGFKITLRPNQQVKLPTGLFLNNELLKKYQETFINNEKELLFYRTPVLKIYPRSSTGLKGLIIPNSVGIIDLDYTQEIMLILRNINNESYNVCHGDKLAQGMFETVLRFPNMIKDEVRTSGFGSTGK